MKMSHFLIAQFEILRGRLQQFLEATSENVADQMPQGFNNTIRWNVGHILTVADTFFGLKSLPVNYKELFWAGTKPADWAGEVPSLETLTSRLQEQTAQIKDAFSDRLEKMLEKPIQLPNGFKIETIGAVFSFNNTHEGVHMGYMNALKRTIERQAK
jgi:uncharacterized damage-inducible protein DinB